MIVTHERRAFAYAIGEEVVVRLAGIDAFDLDEGTSVAPARLPAWTIAGITGQIDGAARGLYAVCFLLRDATCIAVIGEASIDGTA